MTDNLDRYLPEFDEEETKNKLQKFSAEELTDLLIRAYKEKRILAKQLDEALKKLEKIKGIAEEPSALLRMPGIPTAEDLRRKMGSEGDK